MLNSAALQLIHGGRSRALPLHESRPRCPIAPPRRPEFTQADVFLVVELARQRASFGHPADVATAERLNDLAVKIARALPRGRR